MTHRGSRYLLGQESRIQVEEHRGYRQEREQVATLA